MASPAANIARLVVKAWPLVVKNWPRIVLAAGRLTKFLHDNPDIPARLRKTLEAVPGRLAHLVRRDRAARIRGVLDVVRDVAREAQTTIDASSYERRAERIEHGLRLAEAQRQEARSTTLLRLESEADDLLGDLLEALSTERPRAVDSAGADPTGS